MKKKKFGFSHSYFDFSYNSTRFLATYAMAPVAHVLVYYVRDDGEIIADSLDIELDGTLQNRVSKTWVYF